MSSKYRAHKATAEFNAALFKLLAKGVSLPFKLLTEKMSTTLNVNISEAHLRRRIIYYHRQGDIAGNTKDGFYLTDYGLERLADLTLSKPDFNSIKWDQTWRLIAFDIPEEKRAARDAIRRLIKQLGCHQLQRSLWVHPLPCLDRFRQIQQAYGVESDIVLLESKWISNHASLIKHFRKYYPNL